MLQIVPREGESMMRRAKSRRLERWSAAAMAWLVLAMAAGSAETAFAVRVGNPGNDPLPDPGWPKGAVAVFNHPARVQHWIWEDASYIAEFRGDARSLSAILADFAKVDAKSKRLVARNGAGSDLKHPIDWAFNVWVPANGSGRRASQHLTLFSRTSTSALRRRSMSTRAARSIGPT